MTKLVIVKNKSSTKGTKDKVKQELFKKENDAAYMRYVEYVMGKLTSRQHAVHELSVQNVINSLANNLDEVLANADEHSLHPTDALLRTVWVIFEGLKEVHTDQMFNDIADILFKRIKEL